MEAVCGSDSNFGVEASIKKKLLSEYVQAPLEAFVVLLYQNGYNKWSKTFRPKDDDDGETELSSLSNSSQAKMLFLYTGW
jgi:hypothetical protein